jgi:hypothetical protein
MAATKRNAMLIEEAREKIKTTQLINRLQDHGLGEIEMSPTQVRAIEILLKKRVPDLASVALGGGHDGEPIELMAGARETLGKKLGRIIDGEPTVTPEI